MRRLFWLALGATVGILVVRRLTRTARSLTPAGLAESLSATVAGVGDTFREFVADVREAMTEREQELLGALAEDPTQAGQQRSGVEGSG